MLLGRSISSGYVPLRGRSSTGIAAETGRRGASKECSRDGEITSFGPRADRGLLRGHPVSRTGRQPLVGIEADDLKRRLGRPIPGDAGAAWSLGWQFQAGFGSGSEVEEGEGVPA
jgi:hypothetical protein